jgi:hypothetical protein
MKEIIKMVRFKVRVLLHGQIENNIKVNGIKEKCMVKECLHILMEDIIKATSMKIKDMDMEK